MNVPKETRKEKLKGTDADADNFRAMANKKKIYMKALHTALCRAHTDTSFCRDNEICPMKSSPSFSVQMAVSRGIFNLFMEIFLNILDSERPQHFCICSSLLTEAMESCIYQKHWTFFEQKDHLREQ